MERETLRDWIPAYVLGALDADERRQVEALLEEDETTRQLLDDYTRIAEVIALTAPAQSPPADLEDKLRRRLHEKKRRTVDLRPLIVIAALFVAVIVGAILLSSGSASLSDEQLYKRLIADPNTRQIALVPDQSPDVEGVLIYAVDEALAVMRVTNLPQLEEGQIFQVWLVDAEGSMSGGTYQLSPATNYVQLPVTKPVEAYLRFGMTIEPLPGSPFVNRPSGPRLFNIPIVSQ